MKFKKTLMASSLIRKYNVIIVILMLRQLKKWKVFIVSLFLDGLTVLIPSFFGWCSTVEGGGVLGELGGKPVLALQTVTHLSLKLDHSNFVQNHFGVRSIFFGKKNRDQIENNANMTSSLL